MPQCHYGYISYFLGVTIKKWKINLPTCTHYSSELKKGPKFWYSKFHSVFICLLIYFISNLIIV